MTGTREPSGRGLWGHADFLRLWAAQAISAFGSRITRTALPIIAVTTMGQPEVIVGLLAAMQLAPGVILAMMAGGFVDRGRKRRILIGADVVRAVLVGSITLAWALDVRSIVQVVVVGAGVGAATALFQITDVAYLPVLIGRRRLAEGNAKLETTEAIAEITGPASAGVLIAALGAPLAVAIDAASYLWSALMLGRIRVADVMHDRRLAAGGSGASVSSGSSGAPVPPGSSAPRLGSSMVPDASDSSMVPDAPDSPTVPDALDSSMVPDAPDSSMVPGAPDSPMVPGSPNSPRVRGSPDSRMVRGSPDSPMVPDALDSSMVPGALDSPVRASSDASPVAASVSSPAAPDEEAPASGAEPGVDDGGAALPVRTGEDFRIGMRAVFGHPLVRPIVLTLMVWSITGGFFLALYTLFCLRVLALSEATFGVIIAMGGIGSLGGAVLARSLARVLGVGRTLFVTSALSLLCSLFVPIAASAPSHAMMVGFLIAHQLLGDGFAVAFVILAVTLRQTVLPKDVLGRANAAVHVCTSGVLPVFAVLAGGLAAVIGIRAAVWIGFLIGLAAPVFVWRLRHLKHMPTGDLGTNDSGLVRIDARS